MRAAVAVAVLHTFLPSVADSFDGHLAAEKGKQPNHKMRDIYRPSCKRDWQAVSVGDVKSWNPVYTTLF